MRSKRKRRSKRVERRQWMVPIKPNVLVLAGAIVGVVAICARVTTTVVNTTLPTLLTSEVADEVRTSALHLVGVTAGLSWASVALAGLVSWGIRLLDETGDPPPTVPASTHEMVVAALTSDGGIDNALAGLANGTTEEDHT